jgi:hypothetical protein
MDLIVPLSTLELPFLAVPKSRRCAQLGAMIELALRTTDRQVYEICTERTDSRKSSRGSLTGRDKLVKGSCSSTSVLLYSQRCMFRL